jgi:mannose-6-phosphate isomerase-like protein (cupin superfamily)
MKGSASGILIEADQDRDGQRRIVLGDVVIHFKVSARDTAGRLFVLENTQTRRGGPPRHLHADQEEYFYAVQGRYVFEVGGERFEIGPGDSLLAPRRVPHAFTFTCEGQGRLLIAYQPAGMMEAFFTRLAAEPGVPGPADLKRLFAEHGMELTGPPLEM